ncbi:hypothetical protein [Serratia quinivorans]|uniref:hypothetical protein n=1 Tax=Serratia quinivorans TaxID=137545 RepID=UPI003982415F
MNIRALLFSLCVFPFLYTKTVSATPVIAIGSMYDILTPEMQSMTKRIYNTGTSTAFVRVDVLEINPGGEKNDKESPQREVSGNTIEKERLIITPLRMIIPPSLFQTTRILWPGSRLQERYYRVRFTPVMPDAVDSFGLDNHAVNEYRQKSLQAGLNVLTGYGTIVIVQPDNPKFNYLIDHSRPKIISIKNNGNATISLDNIRQCKPGNTEPPRFFWRVLSPEAQAARSLFALEA